MLGAETAQGLPNDQLFYAFLRGAAKQYGLLIWGDASIGNRCVLYGCSSIIAHDRSFQTWHIHSVSYECAALL